MVTRPLSPFTDRDLKLFGALIERLRRDDDPGSVFDESYEFRVATTKKYGRIPMLRFSKNDSQAKADVFRGAGLLSEEQRRGRAERLVADARHVDRVAFDTRWAEKMFQAKKGVAAVAYLSVHFPGLIPLLQQIVLEEYGKDIKKGDKPSSP